MGLRKILILLLMASAMIAQAQEGVYKFFTVKEGLSTNNTFKIKFDRQGFLWIAHDNGISKYDGFTFKHFNHPEQKSNVYTDVFIGPDGKIWMTNLGLQVFYIENNEMKLFRSFNLNFPPSTLRIGFLKSGNMVFNAEGGIIEYDIRTKKNHKTELNFTIQFFSVFNDTVYYNNSVNGYVYKYHDRRIDSVKMNLPNSLIFVNDSIMMSCYNTAKEVDIRYGKGYVNHIRIPLQFNYNYSDVFGDYIYFFTTGNTIRIKLNDTRFIPEEIMKGSSYTHHAKDVLGNSWYSTLNKGIIFMPASRLNKIETEENETFLKLVQFRNSVFGITNNNQLYRLKDQKAEKILDLDKQFNYKPVIVCKNLNNKFLLIGNSRFVFLDSTFKIIPYIKELAMKDATLDNAGNLYMATTGNILYHKFNSVINQKISSQERFNTIDSNIKRYNIIGRFNSVKYDTTKRLLYFGGIPGFFKVGSNGIPLEIKDGNKQIFTSFIDYLPPYLIVGTIQSGVYIIKEGDILRHFDNYNSTLGNTIIKIKLYRKNLWVLSNKGIHTINLDDFKIQSYTYIGAVDLYNSSDFSISGDDLYLISAQKTYVVNLKELRKTPPIIPMYFRYVGFGNTRITDLAKLTFDYNMNSFEIGIESPSAAVLGNAEYEYKVNNNGWFPLNKGQREIYLSQLSPGKYIVSIRQIGIPTIYQLDFVIKKPFWNLWWFYLILTLAAMSIIAMFYINRVNIIRQKTNSEIEKFKLEKALQLNVLSSIRSQMNPHFLFNALNTIQSYIYLNDKKQAINYLGKFSILTRKILEESNRETISLSEEMETLGLYLQLEKMRFENTLEYDITTKGIKFTEQIKIPPMLIQPYVENAVKHGLMHKPHHRKLDVIFEYIDEQKLLQVTIDDNGIGRKRSGEINMKKNSAHRSFSTKANKTRLDILNSDRENPISVRIIDKADEYGNSIGTKVQINIPVL